MPCRLVSIKIVDMNYSNKLTKYCLYLGTACLDKEG